MNNNGYIYILTSAFVGIAYMNEIQINAWCGTYETTQCVYCEVGRETLRIFLDQL
jgi:hypothetical protein